MFLFSQPIVRYMILLYCSPPFTPMVNGEEKSLRHVAMVAIFLDDNKPKIHLKSKFALFQTSFEFNPKGPYLSLNKEKETFCVVFTYSIKRAHEIRKFHAAVVQRRLRNVQKKRYARAELLFF